MCYVQAKKGRERNGKLAKVRMYLRAGHYGHVLITQNNVELVTLKEHIDSFFPILNQGDLTVKSA